MCYRRTMERDLILADTCRHLEARICLERPLAHIPRLDLGSRLRMTVRDAGLEPGRSDQRPAAAVMLFAPLLGAGAWGFFIYVAVSAL